MSENYEIDNLDKSILAALTENARIAYAELAKKFAVSAGTIHVRIEKMKQAGIIEGTKVVLNEKALGFDVCCFIGINLKHAKDYPDTIEKLQALDEVVEAYYTTGNYSIFIKLMTRSIDHLQMTLINKVQAIEAIQSTETLISLQNPINRDVVAVGENQAVSVFSCRRICKVKTSCQFLAVSYQQGQDMSQKLFTTENTKDKIKT